jgi:MoxR-like ATPase
MASVRGLKSDIELAWNAELVPIIWGPPGVGKSAIVKSLAKSQSYFIPKNEKISSISPKLAKVYGHSHIGRPISDVRLVLCSPNDLKGIPVYVQEDRIAVWTMSGMFPASHDRLIELEDMFLDLYYSENKQANHQSRLNYLEKKIEQAAKEQFAVIFLDELTQAAATVQAAAYSLILDKRIGEYIVSPNVSIVAASNRLSDGAMTNKMPTALKSRIIHLEIEVPSIEDFEEYALSENLSSDVIGYLKFHPEHLFKFNPRNLRGENAETAETTFPCPRTWEFVSKLIKKSNKDQYLGDVISGTIGAGTATEFIAWRERYLKLPPCEDVLNGKLKRSDIKFTRLDGETLMTDMSMEYTFIIDCFKILIAGQESKDRVANFISFVMDSSNATVDWGVIVFKLTQESWVKSSADKKLNQNAMLIMANPEMRSFATRMVKEGSF